MVVISVAFARRICRATPGTRGLPNVSKSLSPSAGDEFYMMIGGAKPVRSRRQAAFRARR